MRELGWVLATAVLFTGCKSKSNEAGPTPVATASATPSAAHGPAPARVDAGEVASVDEKKEHALMLAATAKGRSAAAKKDFPAAIAAFTDAVKHAPHDARPLGERGYVRFLSGDSDGAETDLEAARHLGAPPKIAAQIWFNLGLVREQQGDGEGARTAFATSQSLAPTRAAAGKIAGLSTCTVEVSTPADPQPAASWIEAAALVSSEPAPATEADAKNAVCTYSWSADTTGEPHDACDGDAPWLVAHDHAAFFSHVNVVWTGKGGATNLYVLDKGQSGNWPAHCTGGVDVKATKQGKFAWITTTYDGSTGTMIQHGEDTTGAVNLIDQGDFFCADAAGSVDDDFYDLASGAALLHVSRPVAVGAKGPLATLTVQNGVVAIGGAGCNQSIDLKRGKFSSDAGK